MSEDEDVEPTVLAWLDLYGGDGLLLGDLLCERHGDSVAMVFDRSDGTQSIVSYAYLADRSARFATALRDRGVVKGDRIGVLLPRSPELLICLLGIWRVGAVHVPLFTAFGPEAVTYRLLKSGAKVLVTDEENRSKLEPETGVTAVFLVGMPTEEGDIGFDDAIDSATPGCDEPLSGDDPFIILFTSGTTGGAKGVIVPVRALASIHAYMHYAVDLRPDDVYFNFSDPGWGYGLWYGTVGPLLLGSKAFARQGRFSAEMTLDAIASQGITNLGGSPSGFRALREIGVPPDFRAQARLRAISSAGEPLNPELITWAESELGAPIHDHYGQSEIGMVIGFPNNPQLLIPAQPRSMGVPLPGFRPVVLGPDGSELPSGAEGDLAIDIEKSPLYWFSGYLDDPENTAARFPHGGQYYVTGDTAEISPSALFVSATRADDVITSSGYRIGPVDIEDLLSSHDAVKEAAVVGTPDALRGEAVTAFVVLVPDALESEELVVELQNFVRNRLGKHLYPRRIRFLAELPKTASGKVQRKVLRSQWQDSAQL